MTSLISPGPRSKTLPMPSAPRPVLRVKQHRPAPSPASKPAPVVQNPAVTPARPLVKPVQPPVQSPAQPLLKPAEPAPVQSLFRDKALANAARGDSLDALIRPVAAMHWVALLGLMGVLAMAGFWIVYGSVSTRVAGEGILIEPGGVKTAESTIPGQLMKILVNPGDQVKKGQVIAELAVNDSQWPLATRRMVRAGSDGRVLEVLVNIGTLVSVGTPLFTIENADAERAPLQAMLYVPLADAMKLKTDSPVHLSPSTVTREEYGFVVGRMKSIGAFPVTKQAAMSSLSNEQLVDSMLAQGPMLAVVVDLLPDAHAASGYRWSSGIGPEAKLLPGTLCEARFTVRKQHPYELIVPGLKKVSGLADNLD